MRRLFHINGIVFSVEAADGMRAAEILCSKMAPLAVENGHPDIRFIVVPELHGMTEPFTELDKFKVGRSSMYGTGHSRLNYVVSREEDGTLNVMMCPVRKQGLKGLGFRINKGWKYYIRYGCDLETCMAKRFLINLMLPVLFFVMVRRGMTFVHCSAVCREDRTLLFPAWGGVGKTSLMSHFLSHGWDYICDDLAVMDRSGEIHHFPIPMHIYRYHKKVCPAMTDSMERAMTGRERSLWNFASRFVDDSKLVRWIEPVRVFGEKKIVRKARLGVVIHMQRSSAPGEIRLVRATPEKVAKLICNTIVNEIDDIGLMTSLPNAVDAVGFIPDLATVLDSVTRTAAEAMKDAEVYEMFLPSNVTPEQTFRYLSEKWAL
ncbi:MAG: hypothetical protein HPZ91_05980 [Lentisphaeria bacterium]|nr:hypothetical protein [Lentisphaeria bacterium]